MFQDGKKYFHIVYFLIVVLSFASCKKDSAIQQNNSTPIPTPVPTITGSWTATGFSANAGAYLLGIKDSFIFVSSDLLYRTSDNGSNWTILHNPHNSMNGQCFCVNGNDIFLGFVDMIFMSNDNGNNWTEIGSNIGDNVNALAASGNNIYAGTECAVHSNNGSIWTNLYSGFPVSTSSYPYLPAFTLALKDTNLLAGTIGVYLFNQQNSSWSSVSNGLPSGETVYALAVQGNNIFAGTYNHGIYLSNDNGANWTAINNGLPQMPQYNPGYPEINSIRIFGNYIFASTPGRIYLSTDNGTSWTLLGGFPTTNATQSSVLIKDGILYCGGGNVIDPDPDHYNIVGQIWKCPLSSLH